ncbi:MAG: hypothetical protein V4651_10855 [Bacteroidota bacterium]
MKLYHLFLLVILVGCDAVQEKSGVILNSETRLPLEGVAISKYEQEDSTNSFTKRIYSDENGQFEYRSVGGRNSFELFFMKEGFEIKKIKNEDSDTILLEPIK